VTARAASLCQAQQVTARFGNQLRHIFTEIARGIDKWLWSSRRASNQAVEREGISFNACYNAW